MRRFALIGALALIAAGCNVNWAQFRVDAAHSGTQSESAIGTANVAALVPKWSTGLSGVIESSPAVVNGVAFLTTLDGTVDALDAITGAVKWTVAPGSGNQYSSPAVANGIVYVGSDDSRVYALDATTGATDWSVLTGNVVESSPTVVSGVVYVGSSDGKLYALNATTGAVKWTVTTGGGVFSSPAVVSGVVYVGSFDDKLYAVDATTGAVKWTTTTGNLIFSSPSVANGVVYVGSEDGKAYALDATTGAVKWTTATGGRILSSPSVANGVVYIGSDDAKLYALNATTGAVTWTATTGAAVESSPAVANGLVYVGSADAKLWAFDAVTGATKWTGTTTSAIYSSPAVANGVVYIPSTDGTVYAYSQWKFSRPTCTANPNLGLSPCQLQDAYRLPSQVTGAGRTVAIVDAFDDPNAESDLAIYRAAYGLPPCTTANGCFKKLNQAGVAGSYPVGNPNWGIEISLDVDAVSAICPLCHITLVEANDNSDPSLAASEDTAAAQGPTAISNSFGRSELPGDASYESHFSHPGIMTTASTGDSGFGTSAPASSAGVVAVGGTELTADSSTRGWTETVWNGAGSGCSSQNAKPAWQHDPACPNRSIADVSALAGSPGATIYDSYGLVTPGFHPVGGTSLASPIIASVYALAYPDSSIATTYGNTGSLFDITAGSNGTCGGTYLCAGATGYDGPTGLGTPCGTASFGTGPFVTSTCPAPSAGAAAKAAANPPPDVFTPVCGPVKPGYSRCLAYKITTR